MSKDLLTFKDGKFLLRVAIPRTKLTNAELWTRVDANTFETTHLKAAAAFKSLASPNTQKIFDKLFVKFYDDLVLPPLPFLDPHQLDGVRWILSRSRSYLAHAPGAGKTAQAIVSACLLPTDDVWGYQTLFIVPPTLTVNWAREIEKFAAHFPSAVWPDVEIVPPSAQKLSMRWKAEFIICPDSMLTKPWVYSRLSTINFKLIAVDEASRFKESMTARSLALYGGKRGGTDGGQKFSGLYRRARHTVLMDGSPMPNRPMELWAPTFALNPEAIECLSQEDFGFKYCGATITDRGQYEFKHSSNEYELRRRIRKDFMHVVGEDQLKHPERRRSILFMNKDVRSVEHKTWERKHLSEAIKNIDEESSQGELAKWRRELGLRKVKWIAEYVGERLSEKNESILLFVWHREVALELLKLLSKDHFVGAVIGGTSKTYREDLFAEFQKGRTKCIIGNIQAMGRGHNLQKADRVIFGEFSWTDELNIQCEKRASRRGSEKEFVRCEYIAVPGSMDEKILQSNFTKARRVRAVIG